MRRFAFLMVLVAGAAVAQVCDDPNANWLGNQPKNCSGGTRDGLVCWEDANCTGGGTCANVNSAQQCVGGANDGAACLYSIDCPNGRCGQPLSLTEGANVFGNVADLCTAADTFIVSGDLDTLAELNAQLTDATLADGAHLTQEQVEDIAGALLADGTGDRTGISMVYQDATADFDIAVDHDAAANFVANEHIDWTASSAGTIDPTNYADNDSGGDITAVGNITTGEAFTSGTPGTDLYWSSQSPPSHTSGTLFFDSTVDSLAFMNSESDVIQRPTREILVRVRNATGATITKGEVVYATGTYHAGSDTVQAALARSDALATSQALGVATHDIENNSTGYAVKIGRLEDFDTSAFSVGDEVWLSAVTAGAMTATRPAQPNFTQPVGMITRSHASQGHMSVNVSSVKFGSYTDTRVAFGGSDGFLKEDAGMTYASSTDALTLVGEATVGSAEFTATDSFTDCSTFSATGGGIFFDDSEGIFKKCQDNTLTDLDTGGSGISNVVEDTTPQLGGDLDLNGNLIVGSGGDSGEGLTVDFSDGAADDGFIITDDITSPCTTAPCLRVNTDGVALYSEGGTLFLSTRTSPTALVTYEDVIFGGDTDVYIDSPGTDQLRLVAGGQEGIHLAESSNVVTVTIDDVLELDPQSTPPVTCAAGTEGSMYADSDSNELCFCDGTSWTGIKAGGVCS